MTDIKSMNLGEMTDFFQEIGEPPFRAKQVFQWLHRGARSFDEMTNLSKALREKLAGRCRLYAPAVERKQVDPKDGTVKYLWRLWDGNCIETVLMRYHHGNTVCISSQVGCRMGCAFCASYLGKGETCRRRRCWIRCFSPSWIPVRPSAISCLWASGSRWTISTRYCAFWSW